MGIKMSFCEFYGLAYHYCDMHIFKSDLTSSLQSFPDEVAIVYTTDAFKSLLTLHSCHQTDSTTTDSPCNIKFTANALYESLI